MRSERMFCWEPSDVSDPLVRAAERLYHTTQHPEERIPWGWIARSIKGRSHWRPGEPGKHLLLAAPHESVRDPNQLAGFASGSYLPGYGGYLSYLGVADAHRKRGVGTRLFDQMFKLLAADAGASDEPLPFVVWESRKPTATSSATDGKLWEARVKLFDRVGGFWIDGLELQTPNYGDPSGSPLPMQLFVAPIDKPVNAFTEADLRALAAGLLERIYRMAPSDPLMLRTLTPDCHPRFRPAREAGRRKEREPALVGV